MNIQDECKTCLKRQVERLFCYLSQERFSHESDLKSRIKNAIDKHLEEINMYDTPPQVAVDIYRIIGEMLGLSDPYLKIKQDSMKTAKYIANSVESSALCLQDCVKLSVIGNAIDYGSQNMPNNLHNAIIETMKSAFAINDIGSFLSLLNHAKTLLFIADNAGENYFDEILIRYIVANHDIKVTYLVRGAPIINDLTIDDVLEHKSLFEICDVRSSGVPSPGFVYKLANDEARWHFENDDVILAKGMGNFECLESVKDERLFLLFKVKCSVVERFINKPLNSLIFMQNK